MKTTIDAAGRLVIPKSIRAAAGLRPGMELEVRVCDGRIEIEPAATPITLVREGRWLVAVAAAGVEPMPEGTVERLIEQFREERLDQVSGL